MARFVIREGKNSVRGAANLERARFLQVFALEIQAGARNLIERRRSDNRRPVNARGNSSVRSKNRFEVRRVRLQGCRVHMARVKSKSRIYNYQTADCLLSRITL